MKSLPILSDAMQNLPETPANLLWRLTETDATIWNFLKGFLE